MSKYLQEIDKSNIPEHVAIIMDGNGRWAKERGKIRSEGHKRGAENLRSVMDVAMDCGIKYMTVYAFSTENWSRPKTEITFLMNTLRHVLKKYKKDAIKKDIRLHVIGDRTGLDQDIQEQVDDIIEITKEHTTFNLIIALNYGGRDEITRAVRKIAEDVLENKLDCQNISQEIIGNYLDTTGIPDPDLLIRTSGEQRLSNYLLWQLAYTEFYFTDVKWPDFDEEELHKAIYYYQNRNRRFGAL